MNPAFLLQAKKRIEIFKTDHPKMSRYLKVISNKAFEEGNVIEIKVTDSSGKEYVSNMRITKNDIETLNMILSD